MTGFELDAREREILLTTARNAIAARLLRRCFDFPAPTPQLLLPCGAFVTLKIDGCLRGCIGHITASRPLVDTVREVACESAFQDPRFPPLTAEELPLVHIEISVLSPFHRVRDVDSIEVGTHGILLRKGSRSGLLLPQVATEQGWNREQFLDHTCRKAGLPTETWRSTDAVIEIFSAVVFQEKE